MAEKKSVDPHPVDENPLKLVGEVIPDPWSDDKQKDWPNNPDEVNDEEDK